MFFKSAGLVQYHFTEMLYKSVKDAEPTKMRTCDGEWGEGCWRLRARERPAEALGKAKRVVTATWVLTSVRATKTLSYQGLDLEKTRVVE